MFRTPLFQQFLNEANSGGSATFGFTSMSFDLGENSTVSISKDKFSSLARTAFDEQIKAYYTEMASAEDTDIVARAAIMTKYKEQPYGLTLTENGSCTGYSRSAVTHTVPAISVSALSREDRARAAMAGKRKLKG